MRSSILNTLVLNANYRPLSVVSYRRAVILDINNPKITVLSYYTGKTINSNGKQIKIPAVMIYSVYVSGPSQKMPTKTNIRVRDKSLCGYCGVYLTDDIFSVDHIIPVSMYGRRKDANTWENLVSCCKACNNRKGNRTPREAKMRLLVNPKPLYGLIVSYPAPEEWQQYL
jgi:5-methylcytosine-specific restriction endonuclease McrA